MPLSQRSPLVRAGSAHATYELALHKVAGLRSKRTDRATGTWFGRHYRGPASLASRSSQDALCARRWMFGCRYNEKGSAPRGRSLRALAAQPETFDDRPVAVDVGLGEVIEQPTALPDEQQQAAAAVVVVLVGLEVLGEVGDAAREQRDLHLRGARVALGGAVLGDNLLLDILGKRHGRLL